MTVDPTLLGNIPLFAKLTEPELAALVGLLATRKVARQQTIVRIGEEGTEFYVIQKGRVVVTAPDEQGAEVKIAELGPGNFLGEISLLDGGPRTATVRALESVTLLVLERAAFVQFLMTHPSASVHILTTLGARQRELLDKLRGIRNVNEAVAVDRTRLHRFLTYCARLFSSDRFVLANVIFFITWIIVQTELWTGKVDFHDQPPTFFWLGFIITTESIVIGMFVLNSQRRQAERDRVRADLEYQVAVKAHVEVMELHRKVDRLLEQQPPPKDG
jgi:uncharacterized membrane protein